MTRSAPFAQALRSMEANYQDQKQSYESGIRAREDLIRAAHASGWTIREIAAEIGVSFQLIGRIIGREREAA